MSHSTIRSRFAAILAASIVGAVAGGLSLFATYGATASIRFEMDRDLPANVKGFFPPERGGGKSFAWTGRTAEIRVPELNRQAPWVCRANLLGWRPPDAPLPIVRFYVDGVEVLAWQVRSPEDEVSVDVPSRQDGSDGLTLALAVFNTFRPADDPRELGVAVDRIACQPAPGHTSIAPWSAVGRAAGSAALLGAAFGAIGLSWPLAAGGALLGPVAQAWPLSAGTAPYLAGRPPSVPLALGLGLGIIIFTFVLDAFRREPLSRAARIALGGSALLCYLKLVILLHPDMPTMDAVFQAHRLDWVLSGRYYFTSLTPDGYQFPYGISLYLAAAPFASLTRDHVALLRIVVCVTEMIAGLCLYGIIAGTWRDRRSAVIALLLFHAVPVSGAVMATANLTNAFGESIALMTVAILVALPLTWPAWAWLLIPILIASIAFVAHFSTFVVLALTLCAVGLLYYLFGGPTLQRVAAWVLIGLGLATLTSVLAFYGHFMSTYRSQAGRLAGEVRTSAAAPGAPQAAGSVSAPSPRSETQAGPAPQSSRPSAPRRLRPSLSERFATLGRRTISAYGWVLPVLAGTGLVLLVRRRLRDRLTLAIVGWLLTLVGCGALAVMTPLELRYHLAVAPALTMLAGLTAASAWIAGGWRRWLTSAAVAAVILAGLRAWYEFVL